MSLKSVYWFGFPGPNYLDKKAINDEEYCNPQAFALSCLDLLEKQSHLSIFWLPPSERPNWNCFLKNGTGFLDAATAYKTNFELFQLAVSSRSIFVKAFFSSIPSCDTKDGQFHIYPSNLACLKQGDMDYVEMRSFFRRYFKHPFITMQSSPFQYAEAGELGHFRLGEQKGIHNFLYSHQGADKEGGQCSFSRKCGEHLTFHSGLENVLYWKPNPDAEELFANSNGVLACATGLIVHRKAFLDLEYSIARLRETWSRLYPSSRDCLLRLRILEEEEISLEELVKSKLMESIWVDPQSPLLAPEMLNTVQGIHLSNMLVAEGFFSKIDFQDTVFDSMQFNLLQCNVTEQKQLPSCFKATPEAIHWLRCWVLAYYPTRIKLRSLQDSLVIDQLEQAFEELRKYLCI